MRDYLEPAFRRGGANSVLKILKANLGGARHLAKAFAETQVKYANSKTNTAQQATADLYESQPVAVDQEFSEKGRAQGIMDSLLGFFDYIVRLSTFVDEKVKATELTGDDAISLREQISTLASVFLQMFKDISDKTSATVRPALTQRYTESEFSRLADTQKLGNATFTLHNDLTKAQPSPH